MMRARMAGFIVMAAGIVLASVTPAAAQEAVQFQGVRAHFNADVVVNSNSKTVLDPQNNPIDRGESAAGNWAFPTQSAAEVRPNCTADPDGLPDDGFFPASSNHPDVQLHYNDNDNGLNARRSPPPPPAPQVPPVDTYTFPTEPGFYSAVHVFATAGNGSARMTVTLNFAVGGPATFTVPDWFFSPAPPGYFLVDGRDRIQPGSGPGTPFFCENANNPAIFGFSVPADETRPLLSVTVVVSPSSPGERSVLSFFGATGVRERRVLDDFKCYDARERVAGGWRKVRVCQ
jgi:hypothetical protein